MAAERLSLAPPPRALSATASPGWDRSRAPNRSLASYAGLASAQPVLAFVLVVSFLSLVGVPPLAGFNAKVLLFAVTVDAGYTWLAVLAVANSVLSLAYYLRVLAPSYFEPLAAPVPVLGRWAKTAALACGVAVVALGVLPEAPLDVFDVARLLPG